MTGESCTSVGRFADLTLAERWDGTHWTIQPTPDPSTTESILYSVSCPSASACVAVGGVADAVVERYS